MRVETELGSWEMVHREPHPLLRPLIRSGYEGYDQAMRQPVHRLEVPHAGIVLIVGFGPAIRVDGTAHTSFVAGLYDQPAFVHDSGRQAGIQANLTPLGARMLLGLPMRELTLQTVPLDEFLGSDLPERLAGLPDWASRFDALDAFLLRRARDAAQPRPDVTYAWSRLEQARGVVRIAELCQELGCSSRHLSARFGEEVGMAPKPFARILRFEQASELLLDGVPAAEVAARCGYHDQPHLSREVRALAGRPPGALAASVMDVQDGVGLVA